MDSNFEKIKIQADLIYKKLLVLLAMAGGSGAYVVKFYERGEYVILSFFLLAFIFATIGIGVNYFEINDLKKEIDKKE